MLRFLRMTLPVLLSFTSALAWCQADSARGAAGAWEVYGGAAFTGNNPAGGNFGAGVGLDRPFARWIGAAGEFTLRAPAAAW